MSNQTNRAVAPAQDFLPLSNKPATRATSLATRPTGPAPPRRRGADYYDSILWRVYPQKASLDEAFTLGVTSCGRRAGVSTVAANLAIRAADHRLGPVLLVDANLAHASLHRSFRMERKPGLVEMLAEGCDPSHAIHASRVEGLSIMPLGAEGLVDRTPCDFDSIAAVLTELRSDYATIVFDLPEVHRLRHTLLIAQQLDSTLFVLRSEKTRRRDAQSAINRLAGDGVNLAGAVVTQQKSYVPSWFRRHA